MKDISDENKVILSGRLTENPVLRYTQKSVPICRFNLAVNMYNRGEKETLFLPIVVWSELGLECSTALQKGSAVKVEGKLVNRQWEDSEGRKHKTIEVVANKVELIIKYKDSSVKENIPKEE